MLRLTGVRPFSYRHDTNTFLINACLLPFAIKQSFIRQDFIVTHKATENSENCLQEMWSSPHTLRHWLRGYYRIITI